MDTKKIEKARFLEIKESICILNTMVHSGDNYKTVILKEGTKIDDNIIDEVLTEEIELLKKAVERFEKNTGLKINVE